MIPCFDYRLSFAQGNFLVSTHLLLKLSFAQGNILLSTHLLLKAIFSTRQSCSLVTLTTQECIKAPCHFQEDFGSLHTTAQGYLSSEWQLVALVASACI
ncbi:hypothetical protein SUGI_0225920 [Cryptomeria japonica]|nr:hypothetical protein SUGI_0225920 [Cryptomeria japonica]